MTDVVVVPSVPASLGKPGPGTKLPDREAKPHAKLSTLFQSKIKANKEHWLWTGSTTHKKGHRFAAPCFSVRVGESTTSTVFSARRLAWLIGNPGQVIGEDEIVVTTCGEKMCVLPAHLEKRKGGGRRRGYTNENIKASAKRRYEKDKPVGEPTHVFLQRGDVESCAAATEDAHINGHTHVEPTVLRTHSLDVISVPPATPTPPPPEPEPQFVEDDGEPVLPSNEDVLLDKVVEAVLPRIPHVNEDDVIKIAAQILDVIKPDIDKHIEAKVEDMFLTMAASLTAKRPAPAPEPEKPREVRTDPKTLPYQERITRIVVQRACFRIEAGNTHRKMLWLVRTYVRGYEAFYVLHTIDKQPYTLLLVETKKDFEKRIGGLHSPLTPWHLNQCREHAKHNQDLLNSILPIPPKYTQHD
jgi:hypothetical protein